MGQSAMSDADAVNVLAAALLSEQPVELDWEDAPLIGEFDFRRVQEAAERIARALRPDPAKLAEAHRVLEARAAA